jgi:hypothetical protein
MYCGLLRLPGVEMGITVCYDRSTVNTNSGNLGTNTISGVSKSIPIYLPNYRYMICISYRSYAVDNGFAPN